MYLTKTNKENTTTDILLIHDTYNTGIQGHFSGTSTYAAVYIWMGRRKNIKKRREERRERGRQGRQETKRNEEKQIIYNVDGKYRDTGKRVEIKERWKKEGRREDKPEGWKKAIMLTFDRRGRREGKIIREKMGEHKKDEGREGRKYRIN